VLVLIGVHEVFGVSSQTQSLIVSGGKVSAREGAAVSTELTASGRVVVELLVSTNLGKTARTREISLATVGGIEIEIAPAVLADVVAKTGGLVADTGGTTSRIGAGVDVVNLAESPDTKIRLGITWILLVSNITVLTERIGGEGLTNDGSVDELSGVEERAVESTLVESDDLRLRVRKEETVGGIVENIEVAPELACRAEVENRPRAKTNVVGIQCEGRVVLEEPSSGNGELETRGTTIASIGI
jgi:hypothetical protein